MTSTQADVKQTGRQSTFSDRSGGGKQPLVVYLFFGFYLLLGLLVYDDYGVSADETINRTNGIVTAKYLLGILKPEMRDSPELKRIPDLHDYRDKDYGVAFELPVFLLEVLLGIERHSPALYKTRHLCTFLVFFAGVVFFFRLARYRFGNWKPALLGCVFLITSPRIFAESFYNSKDVVLLACFIISTYFLVRYLDDKRIKDAALLAVVAALTINVRILGILIPLVTIGFAVWDVIQANDTKKALRAVLPGLLVFLLLFVCGTVLLWPYLWVNPAGNFLQIFRNMSHFRWTGRVMYQGEFVWVTELPWHYVPVWISITTPLLYVVLFVVGAVLILRKALRAGWRLYRNSQERQDLVFLALCLGPVSAIILLNSVLYDGWRQLYFVYGSFLLVSLRGMLGWWNWVGNRLKGQTQQLVRWGTIGLTGVSIGTVLYCMVRVHPFQNVYFNALAGQQIETTYERDYWGLSYRKALEYIAAADKRDTVVIAANVFVPARSNEFMLPKADQRRVWFAKSGTAGDPPQAATNSEDFLLKKPDYYLTEYRYVKGSRVETIQVGANAYALGKELFSVRVDNIKIMSVYRVE